MTIVGPGGIGKTRLAVEHAAAVADRFGDGTWLVDLAGLEQPEAAWHKITETLALAVARPSAATIADAIAGRDMLVVLDNCEQSLGRSARWSTRWPTVTPRSRRCRPAARGCRTGGSASWRSRRSHGAAAAERRRWSSSWRALPSSASRSVSRVAGTTCWRGCVRRSAASRWRSSWRSPSSGT